MTSLFREQVQQDIRNVFINMDELGKTIQWNGFPLAVVEDANIPVESQYAQGEDLVVRRVVCSDRALTPHPVPYESVVVDGYDWLIRDVRNPPGFLLITMERRRG